MKQILRYPSSKWSLASWIISKFPEHHTYLEPFFGSGAVLFNKKRSNIETINDIDGNVVNLFKWIRKDPERLAKEIYYTPYARQIYEDVFTSIPQDSFEQAVNFLIRLNMGYGGRTTGEKNGWKYDLAARERAYASQNWCRLPEQIYEAAERLRGVQIENQNAFKLIQRYNSEKVLIYCDPPYMLKTRYGKQYRYELTDCRYGGKAADEAKSWIKLLLITIIPLTLGTVIYCHLSKDGATDVTIAEIDKDLASISFDYAGHDITMVIGNDFSQRQYRHLDIDGVRYDLAIGPKDDSGVPTTVTECDPQRCPVQKDETEAGL